MGQQGYQIVEATSIGELQEAVEKEQELGWQCQGGICIQHDKDEDWFYQAMILPPADIEV